MKFTSCKYVNILMFKCLPLLMLFVYCQVQAQHSYVEMLLPVKQEHVPRYEAQVKRQSPILVQMPFNSDSIINPEIFKEVAKIQAERIDLVYTSYRESNSFDQPVLNRGRLTSLEKHAPYLFDNPLTDWHFIAQTGASTADSAAVFFHGFIIYPKKALTPTDIEAERHTIYSTMDSIDAFLKKNDSTCLIQVTEMKKKWVATGYFRPQSKYLQRQGKKSSEQSAQYPYTEKRLVRDTVVRYDSVLCYGGKIDSHVTKLLPDTDVIQILERHPEWDSSIIITDVTASMSPYTVQLLVWYRLRELNGQVMQFEFFNDGDNMPDRYKRLGSTGGIYFSDAAKGYDAMEAAMMYAMGRGTGGDIPENNIEALLKAIEYYPYCKNIIMLADNWAPVKDIALLSKVMKPIKVIVCGSENGIINPHYLDIARATSGSIHLLQQDIDSLGNIKEGETITLGKRQYKLIGGKFAIVGYN